MNDPERFCGRATRSIPFFPTTGLQSLWFGNFAEFQYSNICSSQVLPLGWRGRRARRYHNEIYLVITYAIGEGIRKTRRHQFDGNYRKNTKVYWKTTGWNDRSRKHGKQTLADLGDIATT